jgi:mRNA interferase MazF
MARYNRGEVWLIDLGYVAKIRPCLILSLPALETDRALATVVTHTTSTRGTDFEVDVMADFLKPGAFDVQNIASVSHAKFIRKLGTLTEKQLSKVERVVLEYLGF